MAKAPLHRAATEDSEASFASLRCLLALMGDVRTELWHAGHKPFMIMSIESASWQAIAIGGCRDQSQGTL